jgi:hypothetical protein
MDPALRISPGEISDIFLLTNPQFGTIVCVCVYPQSLTINVPKSIALFLDQGKNEHRFPPPCLAATSWLYAFPVPTPALSLCILSFKLPPRVHSLPDPNTGENLESL